MSSRIDWPSGRRQDRSRVSRAVAHRSACLLVDDLEVSMADPCAPLAPCNDLDGKLLMQRSVYGPQLAFDPGTVSLAGLSTRGAALRGVLDLLFEVRWRSTGLCQGPATSVMGLAPGEVVTVGLRTRSTRTFSSLVRDAAESSRSSSHSERDMG